MWTFSWLPRKAFMYCLCFQWPIYWYSIFVLWCSAGPTGSPYSHPLHHHAKRYKMLCSMSAALSLYFSMCMRQCGDFKHGMWAVCLLLQFQLSYSDKQRYEMEERPDVQKQILVEIARKLPIFTRAQSGGKRPSQRIFLLIVFNISSSFIRKTLVD